VGYAEGKNRLTGMLGALRLAMPVSGNTFEVGTGFKDAERNWTGAKKRWPVGKVITYKYQNMTAKGVPRFPVFQRVRTDKSWEEVVADAQKDADDKAAGSSAPSIARQPSLMAEALASKRQHASTAAAAAAAPPAPCRTASGRSLLFTDDDQVSSVAAIAEVIAAREDEEPPRKRAKAAVASADEPSAPGKRAVWSWRSSSGWTAYADAEAEVLEAARTQAADLRVDRVTLPSGYVVDLERMEQWKADAPKKKRGVRRELKDIVTRKLTRMLSEGVGASDE